MGMYVDMVDGVPMIRVLCDAGTCPNDMTCDARTLILTSPNEEEDYPENFYLACCADCADTIVRQEDLEGWQRPPYAPSMAVMIARYEFLPPMFIDKKLYVDLIEKSQEAGNRRLAEEAQASLTD